MHAPNIYKIIKQKLTELKGEVDKSTIIAKHFNMLHAVTDRTSKNSVIKNTDLNNAINQLELTDACRTPHPATAERTFFSSIHGPLGSFSSPASHARSLEVTAPS